MNMINRSHDHRSTYSQLRGLIDFVSYIPMNSTVIEIGSYSGDSTELIALRCSKLYTIDPLLSDLSSAERGNLNLIFNEKIHRFGNKIEVIRRRNIDVVLKFKDESIDVIYIDGDHSYEAVKQDIINWYPKIKPNGIIGGHDFGNPITPRCARGIRDTLGEPDLIFVDWSWLKYKTKKLL